MAQNFEYTFPAIRGIQAGREYYVSMCPLRLIPRIFLFNDEELVPEIRAQRTLNSNRIPELASYITNNKDSYVFSALTASINGNIEFEPLGIQGDDSRLGSLIIDMDSQFIINDGQHRRAAIQQALKDEPSLADETIAVVFFLDRGLERCQQMFADLNRYSIRPSKSLGILYDYRDDMALLTKSVVFKSKTFNGLVEMEKSSLSPRSRKLFTLSSIYGGIDSLLHGNEIKDVDEVVELCTEYWDTVGEQLPEWELVRESKISSGDVRRDFLHSHAIIIQALGRVGAELVKLEKVQWKSLLKKLKTINWSRSDVSSWEGRAMVGGRVSKSTNHVTLTTNFIKNHLKISLSSTEIKIENAFLRGGNE